MCLLPILLGLFSHSVKCKTNALNVPSVCLCMYVCVSVWCLCVQVEKALEERKNEVETLRQQVICVA